MILTISQIMWCLDIHKCLESDGDRCELMVDFEEKNFAVSIFSVIHGNKIIIILLFVFLLDHNPVKSFCIYRIYIVVNCK